MALNGTGASLGLWWVRSVGGAPAGDPRTWASRTLPLLPYTTTASPNRMDMRCADLMALNGKMAQMAQMALNITK